jgi:hypothetical protein
MPAPISRSVCGLIPRSLRLSRISRAVPLGPRRRYWASSAWAREVAIRRYTMAIRHDVRWALVAAGCDYSCLGGQGTVAYEQNTQQSPGFGLTSARQAGHSQNHTHESPGMVSCVSAPQCGQRIVASVTGSVMDGIYLRRDIGPSPPMLRHAKQGSTAIRKGVVAHPVRLGA